jgi:hypothetical protein
MSVTRRVMPTSVVVEVDVSDWTRVFHVHERGVEGKHIYVVDEDPGCWWRWCIWLTVIMINDDGVALCWWRGAYSGWVSRLTLAKTIWRGGDVWMEKLAMEREGISWGAVQNLLGTVVGENLLLISRHRGWSRGAWWRHEEQTGQVFGG